ncbi:uncharacterized protein LOC143767433 [Ranitomeya variabilis]|uniref:uncharacterized protein LOC143767433 n=1 Tax=Ranitomeya variabilis TaxID=490064 RepID=UPI004056B4B5
MKDTVSFMGSASIDTSVQRAEAPTLWQNARDHPKKLTPGKIPLQVRLTMPVSVKRMEPWLDKYPNKAAAAQLRFGFSYGFFIPFNWSPEPQSATNLQSAKDLPDVLAAKLDKEIRLGRFRGPFNFPPFPNLRVSPLGIVPKKESGKYRLIHHLSYPKGMSVNDGIPRDETAVSYISFDKAIDLVRSAGPGALMAKSDIESAFRLLPVHPDCHHLLGAKFEDRYNYDTCLPMGCSISCFYFELFSTFLEWVARKITRQTAITHYLDDFLIVGPAGSDVCSTTLAQFKDAMEHFGVPLSPEKTIGPVSVITFLGIEIDSVAMEFRLPMEKIKKLLDLISGCISVGKVTLTQMQSMLGSLNFACKVMPAGRIFSRRLMLATRGVKQSLHRIRITAHLRSDLNTWKLFLNNYNGRTCFQESECSNEDMGLFFAASSHTGFSIRLGNKLCSANWPAFWVFRNWHAEPTLIDLLPVAVAMEIWGSQLANKRIRLHLKTVSGAHAINYLASPSSLVLDLIRFIVLKCLTFNVWFKANALIGSNENVSELLTGFHSQDVLERRIQEQLEEVDCPHSIWDVLGT